jgi:Fic family protein
MVYIRKKRIKNNEYYYLVKSIRIGKNKWQKIERYLGKKLPSKKVLKEMEIDFDKTKTFLDKKMHFLNDIQNLYKDKIKNSSKDALRNLEEGLLIKFTYNTTRIEGGTLSYSDTLTLLKHQISPRAKPLRDVKETENHKEVFLYLKNNIGKKINEDIILRIHDLLKKGITEDAGKFRTANVTVGDLVPVRPSLIRGEIKNLIQWYENNKKMHCFELATIFHCEFERIHPFFDGNGRVGRLLMNFILMKNDFPLIIIQNKNRKRYYRSLRKADDGNYLPMLKYLLFELKQQESYYKK